MKSPAFRVLRKEHSRHGNSRGLKTGTSKIFPTRRPVWLEKKGQGERGVREWGRRRSKKCEGPGSEKSSLDLI